VRDREIFPFVLPEPLIAEILGGVPVLDENRHGSGADHIEALVRARPEAPKIALVAEFGHTPLQGFLRTVRERCQVVEGGHLKLVHVVHDVRVALIELEAGIFHRARLPSIGRSRDSNIRRRCLKSR